MTAYCAHCGQWRRLIPQLLWCQQCLDTWRNGSQARTYKP